MFLRDHYSQDKNECLTWYLYVHFKFVAPTLDIEKPEYQPETFSIFPVLIYSSVYVGPESVFINVTVPIHLRYHLPQTDYRQFSIWKPQILLRCTNNAGRFFVYSGTCLNPTHQGTMVMCRIEQDVGILRFYFS